MKAVILAGGRGSRISEESNSRPKPLVEIGGKPILWHIMNIYARHGIDEFIVCAGYKGYMIKEYFANLVLHHADITVDLGRNRIEYHNFSPISWKVTVVDTGLDTMTGGRVRRIAKWLDGKPFCLTYGDGVADIDISALVAFHKRHGLDATMTTVRPPARFGAVQIDAENRITAFREKQHAEAGFINGGFFVLNPGVIDLIEGDDTVWEGAPLEKLADAGRLAAYKHEGFWQPMDTLREKNLLEELWESGRAPWM
ncbi:MAG: glucose-1-phosphate cytidylyltransferase [Rhodospirillales bacterium]|nr:glucose-1-phosphate cytidylyltransferase [Rhodospirillales bacterium]